MPDYGSLQALRMIGLRELAMTEPEDIVERLREAARSKSEATQLVAKLKSNRNIANGDVGASYDWLAPEETVEWQAAAFIKQQDAEITRLRAALAAERERCARVAEYESQWFDKGGKLAAKRIAAAIRAMES